MRNIFKLKSSKEEKETKEKKGIFLKSTTKEENESKKKQDFLEDDEDLGYC
ncbi:MAG TPA: hypothetical protein PK006_11340 [Saprospiraceae bacterium]|nr:hypothetical protein [Saprospiraceae bacterium]